MSHTEYLGIRIDFDRDNLLTDFSLRLLKDYYLAPGETSPQQAFARASVAFSAGDQALAQRLYDYASNLWFMYASPVLSNAPLPGQKAKALPISCFLTYVPDTVEGLIEHTAELRWLSVKGGGVGGHWSDVRSVSDVAPGPIPFLKTVDADMTAYRQGRTRKGSYAAYLDVSHPDILEFLQIRVPTGGDPNRKCLNLHNAINITDDFMEAVVAGEKWELRDPNDDSVRDTLEARELWQRILETRFRTGEPYLNFIDAANRALPEPLKQRGLRIHGSNLCNEIHLPTHEGRTAVCCLSSVNLEKYDQWKDTQMVADLITMLDNVLQFFIDNAPEVLRSAVYSAKRERSLGLGAMGFHGYLQQHAVPFESAAAAAINEVIFADIQDKAVSQTMKLAKERGEYLDGVGSGRRNAHLLAIAPNANNSIIAGCSSSIEPIKSNAYTHRTRAGSHLVKNKYLETVLGRYAIEFDKGQDWLDEQWQSIILNGGSVQHLGYLTQEERDTFKTAFELDQRWVVDHAAARQKYICQGQSLNLFFPYGTSKALVNQVHIRAWEKNLKGLYYLRTEAGRTGEKVSQKIERKALADAAPKPAAVNNEECLACEG